MDPPCLLDYLPLETLHLIAQDAYYGLLAYPRFARSLTLDKRLDYAIDRGHTVEITKNQILWKWRGLTHRNDGPAISTPYYEEWYHYDTKHRMDGPSHVSLLGDERWCLYGKLHQSDGPAFIQQVKYDGYAIGWVPAYHIDQIEGIEYSWYEMGKLHRDNDPAYICETEEWWYQNDELHRTDGPAVISQNGREYYVHGRKMSAEDFYWKFGRL